MWVISTIFPIIHTCSSGILAIGYITDMNDRFHRPILVYLPLPRVVAASKTAASRAYIDE